MLAGSLGMLFTAPTGAALLGLTFVAACMLALVTYWRLAIATALRHSFHFGPKFWLAVAGALFVAIEVHGWFSGPETILLLVLPPAASAGYFAWLQRRSSFGLSDEG